MTADDPSLTRAFEAERPRLLRVACATVGSLADAEDCVQEASRKDRVGPCYRVPGR